MDVQLSNLQHLCECGSKSESDAPDEEAMFKDGR